MVGEGETAVLSSAGRAADVFPPGQYTLETANLPLLGSIITLPFGGKTPFPAELWYICTRDVMDIKWGTDAPVLLFDERSNAMLPFRGYGQFGVRVEDPKLFLTLQCRILSDFTKADLFGNFRGVIMAVVKDSMADCLRQRGGVAGLGGGLVALSHNIWEQLAPEFAAYGIRLLNFYVADMTWQQPPTQGVRP